MYDSFDGRLCRVLLLKGENIICYLILFIIFIILLICSVNRCTDCVANNIIMRTEVIVCILLVSVGPHSSQLCDSCPSRRVQ